MLPTLSLIMDARNDEYMGNARWRLETSLNYLGERLAALGRDDDVEVVLTDWGSGVPLRDVVALEPVAARMVSFITVPPALARELQRDSSFPDVLALNAAVRRARGTYIGRIDQDTLVGERFIRWFFDAVEGVRPPPPGATLDTAFFFGEPPEPSVSLRVGLAESAARGEVCPMVWGHAVRVSEESRDW